MLNPIQPIEIRHFHLFAGLGWVQPMAVALSVSQPMLEG